MKKNRLNNKNYHRDKEYKENEALFENIFRKRINLISKFIKKGKVLEIGSATGVMLGLFKNRGWEVLGVEPSGSNLEAKKKKFNIIRSKFEDAELPEKDFNLVVLNHTLEHMDNPSSVLKKINLLLNNYGVLFIDVPNFGSLSSRILRKKWPYLLPKEHKWQFTKASLKNLLEQTGFKVIYWESRSGLFEYANPLLELWQSLTGLKKRFFFDLVTLPYALCVTLLNMGDSMSFVAEKK